MEAKDTERIEALKNCLAKWFDRGRDYGTASITKDILAELEADGEAQAEITFKAGREAERAFILQNTDRDERARKEGIREVVEWVEDTDILVMLSPRKREEWKSKFGVSK